MPEKTNLDGYPVGSSHPNSIEGEVDLGRVMGDGIKKVIENSEIMEKEVDEQFRSIRSGCAPRGSRFRF